MNQYLFKTCDPQQDREAIIDLYDAVRDELHLPDRQTVADMVDLLFTHGGVTGGYFQHRLVGAVGYFFGDPARQFDDKRILFLYVGAILPHFRGTRLFRSGLMFTLHGMRHRADEIRLQAEASNRFTNTLYGRFAQPLGRDKSLRGKDVITYGTRIEDALAKLTRKPSAPKACFNPAPHHQVPVVLR